MNDRPDQTPDLAASADATDEALSVPASLRPGSDPRRQPRWVTTLKIVIPAAVIVAAMLPISVLIGGGGVGTDVCATEAECRFARSQLLFVVIASVLLYGGAIGSLVLSLSRRWWIPASIMGIGAIPFIWMFAAL
jgi:hypothetical protein